MVNMCWFMGRLTDDIELKISNSGNSYINFTIAVQDRFENQDGDHDTDWIRCTAFKKTAEFIAKYFRKGYMISVIGNLKTRSYQTKEGETKYTWNLRVNEVSFTGERHDNDNYSYNNTQVNPENNNYYVQQNSNYNAQPQQNGWYNQAQQNYPQSAIPDYGVDGSYDNIADEDLPF